MPSLLSFASALAPVDADNPALAAAQAKPNKGIILRKSVEYIRQLQQFLDIQMKRNNMLESELYQLYNLRLQGASASESHESLPPHLSQPCVPVTACWNEEPKVEKLMPRASSTHNDPGAVKREPGDP